jgi:hypothetical protein
MIFLIDTYVRNDTDSSEDYAKERYNRINGNCPQGRDQMIGTSSFILELAMPIFVGIFILIGIRPSSEKKKKSHYFTLGFLILIWLIVGIRYFNQMRNHIILGSLDANAISQIQVGGKTFTEGDHLRLISESLRDNKWFSSNHGGFAEAMPLIITFKSGRTRRFRTSYYLRQEGAIILFYRGKGISYWDDGYAFCPNLPVTLNRLGLQLPKQPMTSY